jgi:hypothetical protein
MWLIVRRVVTPQPIRDQIPGLSLWCLIKTEYSFSKRRCSRRQPDACGVTLLTVSQSSHRLQCIRLRM